MQPLSDVERQLMAHFGSRTAAFGFSPTLGKVGMAFLLADNPVSLGDLAAMVDDHARELLPALTLMERLGLIARIDNVGDPEHLYTWRPEAWERLMAAGIDAAAEVRFHLNAAKPQLTPDRPQVRHRVDEALRFLQLYEREWQAVRARWTMGEAA